MNTSVQQIHEPQPLLAACLTSTPCGRHKSRTRHRQKRAYTMRVMTELMDSSEMRVMCVCQGHTFRENENSPSYYVDFFVEHALKM